MKAIKIENGLAVVGAIVVLIGVSFAAGNALAEDHATVTTTAEAVENTTHSTLNSAEQANAETAAAALASLALENRIELDIQLRGRTSTLTERS
jgi:hypothetical protein